MPQYNLTERQREIVRDLVAAGAELAEEEFWWLATARQQAIEMGDRAIPATKSDMLILEAEGFITLSGEGGALAGMIRQRAKEAVEANFATPEPAAIAPTVNIGNYIESMAGGNVQGAVGAQFTQQQTINDAEALMALFRATTDQLTAALAALLPPQQLRTALQDVSAVQQAAEAGDQDHSALARHVWSLGHTILGILDVSDKLGGTMQALVYLGPWAHMAYQIIQSSNTFAKAGLG
jgi:hypothetical protein